MAWGHAGYGTQVGVLDGWRHCPRCGSELRRRADRLECSSCDFTYYPHSVPAVAAVITDDEGRGLLARRAREPDAGRWDTPGGFLEEAEDPLEGLRRELRWFAPAELPEADEYAFSWLAPFFREWVAEDGSEEAPKGRNFRPFG